MLEEHPVTELLILPGHHLYRMDYQDLIQAHRNSNADITVAVSSKTNKNHQSEFLRVNNKNQITEYIEKLDGKNGVLTKLSISSDILHMTSSFMKEREFLSYFLLIELRRITLMLLIEYVRGARLSICLIMYFLQGCFYPILLLQPFDFYSNLMDMLFESQAGSSKLSDAAYLASMGIYIIKTDVIIKLLTEFFLSANHFGSQIISGAISMGMKVSFSVPTISKVV